jgi:hypothetical protein
VHFIMDFPAELIGAEEMQRIIAHGEDEETTAIMLNPSVSDKVASQTARHVTTVTRLSIAEILL